MDIESVRKLAGLCRIKMSDTEMEELRKEMGVILGYVGEISDVATEEHTPEAGSVRNIMRDDGEPHTSGAYTGAIMAEVPDREGEYVKVKQIL